jgi:hypothetical protein
LILSSNRRGSPPEWLVIALGEDCVPDAPKVEAEIEVVAVLLMKEVFEEAFDEDIDDEVDKRLEDAVDIKNGAEND